MSLRKKVTFGVKWATASLVVVRMVRFVTLVVLARILTPEIFGLVAMANVVVETIGVIREIGFGAAYIQRQDKEENSAKIAANTAFIFGLIISLILFAGLLLFSPKIALFFKLEALENVVKVMAFTFIIDPVLGICGVILNKELEFGKIATGEITQIVAYSIIAVLLAFLGFGVWSIVLGTLISKLIHTIVLLYFSGWRPTVQVDLRVAKEMFAFGKYMWAFAILSAAGRALDRVLIGRFWGTASLGHYHIAFNLCNMPATAISFLINKITFPVFSQFQDDTIRLKNALLRILSIVSIVVMPLSLGLIATADIFVLSIYGPKWSQVIPLVQVLAIYGMTLSISAVTGPVFKAIGKPNILLYTSLNHHIILVISLILLRNYGVIGICYALLIPIVISALIAFVLIIKLLHIHWNELIIPIIKPGLAATIMFLMVKAFQNHSLLAFMVSPILKLTVLIMIGALTYTITSICLNRTLFNDFRYTVFEIIKSKGKVT